TSGKRCTTIQREPRSDLPRLSSKGMDYPLIKAGLEYLLATLDKGARKDGKAVSHTLVVLADPDENAGLKLVSYSTGQETRDGLKGIKPRLGDWGWFWWLSADGTPQVASGGSFVNDDEGF